MVQCPFPPAPLLPALPALLSLRAWGLAIGEAWSACSHSPSSTCWAAACGSLGLVSPTCTCFCEWHVRVGMACGNGVWEWCVCAREWCVPMCARALVFALRTRAYLGVHGRHGLLPIRRGWPACHKTDWPAVSRGRAHRSAKGSLAARVLGPGAI